MVWLFQQAAAANAFPVSNQFMIGDYVVPGNMSIPSQGLNNVSSYKSVSWGRVSSVLLTP